MATVELTFSQIIEAVRQLPVAQRERLRKEIDRLPDPECAREAARRTRDSFRLPADRRRRMSVLLSKGNAGTLSPAESSELDGLVEEFERKTLAMAESLAEPSKAKDLQPRPSSRRRGPRR